MKSDPFRINAPYTGAETSFFNDWQHIKELQVVADMAADSGCEYLEKELRERISRVQTLNRVKYTKAKVSPIPGLQKLLNDIGPKLEVEIQILTEE